MSDKTFPILGKVDILERDLKNVMQYLTLYQSEIEEILAVNAIDGHLEVAVRNIVSPTATLNLTTIITTQAIELYPRADLMILNNLPLTQSNPNIINLFSGKFIIFIGNLRDSPLYLPLWMRWQILVEKTLWFCDRYSEKMVVFVRTMGVHPRSPWEIKTRNDYEKN